MGNPSRGQRGFTLIEILVVVGIFAVLAAVSLPQIATYIKNYQIRTAAQQVVGEIQAARIKAVSRNVNYGLLFVVLGPQQYRWVLEDLPGAGVAPMAAADWPSLTSDLLPNPGQLGPLRTLPADVMFDDGSNCPGFAPNASGFRFQRLGNWCGPTPTPDAKCPALDTGYPVVLYNVAAGPNSGSTVCVFQPSSGLRRSIRVTPGGRAQMVEP